MGGKIFGVPKGSRSREPVMCQAPYPPAHHICNVSRNGACGHIANAMCPRAPFRGTLQMWCAGGVWGLAHHWFALTRTFWYSKNFPPQFAQPFFFMVAQLIICSTKFHPWYVRFLCGRYGAGKLNQIWVPLNTIDYFKWMNYWISDSACFLLTRRQLIPNRKGEELSFCEMVGEWKSLGCALFWHCFRRETEIP